ncbi:hypothetical protein FNF31_07390 [Cafeteria roenbergensis]|uniref:RecF/RecN/SMC N-terminal domain-containing protein n=1 Tax=Cafeteria roenbergensis TaxID=33653 RepID=A0A5A8C9I4_CAFRO|nr:hypothetical protein FNF31_07390 [Cafeteria roenbergensis]KAA0171288.1 hypothetical protein FNF28_00779 [Cafeteria roenbergensis]
MQRSSKRRRRARAAPEDDFDVPTGPAAAAAAGAAGAAADSGPASGVEADDFAVFGAPGALTSAGVLLKLELRDFMCHEHCLIKFGPRINFITGRNGSGKSAVATAICMAFGATASQVVKEATLADLVRNGASKAVIELSISNVGSHAFCPELYGGVITVSRSITRTGENRATSSYSLRGESGTEVSKKRDDLRSLCSRMRIDVTNPLQYTGQEAMKEFTQTSGVALHAFLAKGTGLEAFLENISQTRARLQEMKDNIKLAQADEPLLEERHTELKRQQEAIEEAMHSKERHKEALNAAAWAELLEKKRACERAEREAEELEGKVAGFKRHLDKMASEATKLDDQAAEQEAELEKTREESAALGRDVERLTEQHRVGFALRIDAIKKRMAQIKAAARSEATARHRLERQRESILADQARQLGDTALQEADAKVAETEQGIQALQEGSGETDAALRRARHEHEDAEAAYSDAKAALRNAEAAVDSIRAQARDARDGSATVDVAPGVRINVSRLQLMGTKVADVVKLLLRNRSHFSAPIIGPLGAMLNVRPERRDLALQAEVALSNTTMHFVTATTADALAASSLLTRSGVTSRCTFTTMGEVPESSRERLMQRGRELPPGCVGLFDVIDGDKLPIRTLCAIADSVNVDKLLLSGLDTEGASLVAQQSDKSVVDRFGTTHSAKRIRGVISAVRARPCPERLSGGHGVLQVDDSGAAEALERQAARLVRNRDDQMRAFEAAAEARRAASLKLDSLEARSRHDREETRRLRARLAEWQAKVEAIRAKLADAGEEQAAMADKLESLAQQITEAKERESECRAEAEEAQAELHRVVEDAKPLLAEVDELKAKLSQVSETSELAREVGLLRDKATELRATANSVRHGSMAQTMKQAAAAQERATTMRGDVGGQETSLQELTGLAEPPPDAAKGVEWCERRKAKLAASLEAAKQVAAAQGLDVERIRASLEAVEAQLEKRRDRAEALKALRVKLRSHRSTSHDTFRRMQADIQANAAARFSAILAERGHSGSLDFETTKSGATACVVKVQTHAVAGSDDAGLDGTQMAYDDDDDEEDEGGEGAAGGARATGRMELGALSGGEKAMTSVALLLAFGESVPAPWRMFDEFDVFMDEANRKLAMDLLVAHGGSNGRQLVCLTPLDISSAIKPGPGVAVVDLGRPRREGDPAPGAA